MDDRVGVAALRLRDDHSILRNCRRTLECPGVVRPRGENRFDERVGLLQAFLRLDEVTQIETGRYALNFRHTPVAVAHLLHEIEIAARVTREPFQILQRRRDQSLPGVRRAGKVLQPLVEPEDLL